MNAGFTAPIHYRNSHAPISHLPGECLTHPCARFGLFWGVALLRWRQPAGGRAEGSPCRGAGLGAWGQGCCELLLSLVQQLFIYFYWTTVSALCSLLVWLVMLPFSFAVPFSFPLPLDWRPLFNLLLYLPNSINSSSEFLFLPYKKPLILRGGVRFCLASGQLFYSKPLPRSKRHPTIHRFFLCHGKS